MWTVAIPDQGDIDQQLDAALLYKDGTCVYRLTPQERSAVHALYRDYDLQLGEPDPILNPQALVGCADALHGAYSEVQKGGRLADVRATLLSGVMECPLCGSGPATTLDHYLPRDGYRALSINPRNLIPSCFPCNRAKGTLIPVAGQGMVHAYYVTVPSVTFLLAQATCAGGSLTVRFSIDDTALDPALYARLDFQLKRLKLTERHPSAINIFLFTLKPSLQFFRGQPSERDLLKKWLESAANSYDHDLGLNHWRTAVLRGLSACDTFLDDPWAYFDTPSTAMRSRS